MPASLKVKSSSQERNAIELGLGLENSRQDLGLRTKPKTETFSIGLEIKTFRN